MEFANVNRCTEDFHNIHIKHTIVYTAQQMESAERLGKMCSIRWPKPDVIIPECQMLFSRRSRFQFYLWLSLLFTFVFLFIPGTTKEINIFVIKYAEACSIPNRIVIQPNSNPMHLHQSTRFLSLSLPLPLENHVYLLFPFPISLSSSASSLFFAYKLHRLTLTATTFVGLHSQHDDKR